MPIQESARLDFLQRAINSTVRVNQRGSGVIICNGTASVIVTAEHVIRGSQPVTVVWATGSAEASVLHSDDAKDVAILSCGGLPSDLGIKWDAEANFYIGDELWVLGFPGGWEDNTPVVVKAELAGVGSQCWIRADCIWGSSGGPVIIELNNEAVLVGIVLGTQGQPQNSLHVVLQAIKERISKASEQHFANGFFSILKIFAELIETHFRSGFVEIATIDQIKSYL